MRGEYYFVALKQRETIKLGSSFKTSMAAEAAYHFELLRKDLLRYRGLPRGAVDDAESVFGQIQDILFSHAKGFRCFLRVWMVREVYLLHQILQRFLFLHTETLKTFISDVGIMGDNFHTQTPSLRTTTLEPIRPQTDDAEGFRKFRTFKFGAIPFMTTNHGVSLGESGDLRPIRAMVCSAVVVVLASGYLLR